MAKRAAEQHGVDLQSPKERRRSQNIRNSTHDAPSESNSEAEFEDEWDSDEEIFEAGEDGQPDAVREADSRGLSLFKRCKLPTLTRLQIIWMWTRTPS